MATTKKPTQGKRNDDNSLHWNQTRDNAATSSRNAGKPTQSSTQTNTANTQGRSQQSQHGGQTSKPAAQTSTSTGKPGLVLPTAKETLTTKSPLQAVAATAAKLGVNMAPPTSGTGFQTLPKQMTALNGMTPMESLQAQAFLKNAPNQSAAELRSTAARLDDNSAARQGMMDTAGFIRNLSPYDQKLPDEQRTAIVQQKNVWHQAQDYIGDLKQWKSQLSSYGEDTAWIDAEIDRAKAWQARAHDIADANRAYSGYTGGKTGDEFHKWNLSPAYTNVASDDAHWESTARAAAGNDTFDIDAYRGQGVDREKWVDPTWQLKESMANEEAYAEYLRRMGDGEAADRLMQDVRETAEAQRVPTWDERAQNLMTSAANRVGGSLLSFGSLAAQATENMSANTARGGRASQLKTSLDDASKRLRHAQNSGNEAEIAKWQGEVDRLNTLLYGGEKYGEDGHLTKEYLYHPYADSPGVSERGHALIEKSRRQLMQAQRGLGGIGQFAMETAGVGLENIPTMGLYALNPVAGAAYMAATVLGEKGDEFSRDEFGAPAYSAQEALLKAAPYAAVETATEALGDSAILGFISKRGSLGLSGIAARAALTEGAEEGAAGILDYGLDYAYGNPEVRNQTAGQVAGDIFKQAVQGGIVGAVMGAGGAFAADAIGSSEQQLDPEWWKNVDTSYNLPMGQRWSPENLVSDEAARMDYLDYLTGESARAYAQGVGSNPGQPVRYDPRTWGDTVNRLVDMYRRGGLSYQEWRNLAKDDGKISLLADTAERDMPVISNDSIEAAANSKVEWLQQVVGELANIQAEYRGDRASRRGEASKTMHDAESVLDDARKNSRIGVSKSGMADDLIRAAGGTVEERNAPASIDDVARRAAELQEQTDETVDLRSMAQKKTAPAQLRQTEQEETDESVDVRGMARKVENKLKQTDMRALAKEHMPDMPQNIEDEVVRQLEDFARARGDIQHMDTTDGRLKSLVEQTHRQVAEQVDAQKQSLSDMIAKDNPVLTAEQVSELVESASDMMPHTRNKDIVKKLKPKIGKMAKESEKSKPKAEGSENTELLPIPESNDKPLITYSKKDGTHTVEVRKFEGKASAGDVVSYDQHVRKDGKQHYYRVIGDTNLGTTEGALWVKDNLNPDSDGHEFTIPKSKITMIMSASDAAVLFGTENKSKQETAEQGKQEISADSASEMPEAIEYEHSDADAPRDSGVAEEDIEDMQDRFFGMSDEEAAEIINLIHSDTINAGDSAVDETDRYQEIIRDTLPDMDERMEKTIFEWAEYTFEGEMDGIPWSRTDIKKLALQLLEKYRKDVVSTRDAVVSAIKAEYPAITDDSISAVMESVSDDMLEQYPADELVKMLKPGIDMLVQQGEQEEVPQLQTDPGISEEEVNRNMESIRAAADELGIEQEPASETEGPFIRDLYRRAGQFTDTHFKSMSTSVRSEIEGVYAEVLEAYDTMLKRGINRTETIKKRLAPAAKAIEKAQKAEQQDRRIVDLHEYMRKNALNLTESDMHEYADLDEIRARYRDSKRLRLREADYTRDASGNKVYHTGAAIDKKGHHTPNIDTYWEELARQFSDVPAVSSWIGRVERNDATMIEAIIAINDSIWSSKDNFVSAETILSNLVEDYIASSEFIDKFGDMYGYRDGEELPFDKAPSAQKQKPRRKKNAPAPKKAEGKPGLVVDDYVLANVSRALQNRLDAAAKALGLEVKFADEVAGGMANAQLDGRTVLIEKGNENPLMFLFGHELTHHLQNVAPDAYGRMKKYFKAQDGFKEKLRDTKANYREKGISASDAYLEDEVVADMAGELIDNEDLLQRFIRANKKKNQNVLQQMWSWLRGLIAKLGSNGRIKEVDRACRLIEDALDEAVRAEFKKRGGIRNSIKFDYVAGQMSLFSQQKEYTGDSGLIAVRGTTKENILRALDDGCFVAPSIAIGPAFVGQVHENNYGNNYIFFPRQVIDPEESVKNVVFAGDAWTPETPTPKTFQRHNEEYGDDLVYSPEAALDYMHTHETRNGLKPYEGAMDFRRPTFNSVDEMREHYDAFLEREYDSGINEEYALAIIVDDMVYVAAKDSNFRDESDDEVRYQLNKLLDVITFLNPRNNSFIENAFATKFPNAAKDLAELFSLYIKKVKSQEAYYFEAKPDMLVPTYKAAAVVLEKDEENIRIEEEIEARFKSLGVPVFWFEDSDSEYDAISQALDVPGVRFSIKKGSSGNESDKKPLGLSELTLAMKRWNGVKWDKGAPITLSDAEREIVFSRINTDYYNKNKKHDGVQFAYRSTDGKNAKFYMYLYEDYGYGSYNIVARIDVGRNEALSYVIREAIENGGSIQAIRAAGRVGHSAGKARDILSRDIDGSDTDTDRQGHYEFRKKVREDIERSESGPDGRRSRADTNRHDEGSKRGGRNSLKITYDKRWGVTDREVDRNEGNDQPAKTITEIVDWVQTQLGVDVASGRMSRRPKSTNGYYTPDNQGIRMRMENNLPTLTHELGHWLDDVTSRKSGGKIGDFVSSLSDEARDELVNNTDVANRYEGRRLQEMEGFAEFIREFLKSKSSAAAKLPTVYRELYNGVDARDMQRMDYLADMVNSYMMGPKKLSSAIRRQNDRVDTRTKFQQAQDRIDELYQTWVDTNHAIELMTRETGDRAPYIAATNAAYAAHRAGAILTKNMYSLDGTTLIGPSLKHALEGAGLNMRDDTEYMDFGAFLVAKHGVERLDRGRVMADDRMNDKVFMRAELVRLNKKYPHFKDAAKALYSFQKDFLYGYAVESGILDRKTADEWQKMWRFYVPFQRYMRDKRGVAKSAQKGFANQVSGIYKFKGSSRDIIHPVDSVIGFVTRMTTVAVLNDTMRTITRSAKAHGLNAQWMKPVETPMTVTKAETDGFKRDVWKFLEGNLDMDAMTDAEIGLLKSGLFSLDDYIEKYSAAKPSGNIVTVYEHGKAEYWEVKDKLLLDSLASMNAKTIDGVAAMAATVTRFMTSNITGRNVVWSLMSNAPRDLFTALVFTQGKGLKGRAELIKGLKDNAVAYFTGNASNNPYYDEFLAMGGGQVTSWNADINNAQKIQKQMNRQVTGLFTALDYISAAIESGPRFAEFQLLRKQGYSPQDAFYGAMDITTNFSRHGNMSRQFNYFVPFFNASVQGIDKFSRWLRATDVEGTKSDRQAASVGRILTWAAGSALMAAIVYGFNNRDDDRRQEYKMLSNYTKNTYFSFNLGDGKFFAVPKPREIAVLESFFESLMDYTLGGNDKAFGEFKNYAIDQFAPPGVAPVLQGNVINGVLSDFGLLGALSAVNSNKDYLGNPIEGQSFESSDTPIKERYNSNTSRTAKWIAGIIADGPFSAELKENASPVKIDYFCKQVFGGFWKAWQLMFPVDTEGESIAGRAGKGFLDVMFGGYTKDALYSNDVVNALYEYQTEQKRAGNEGTGNFDAEFNGKLAERYSGFYSKFYKLTKAESDADEVRDTRRNVLDMIQQFLKQAENDAFPDYIEELRRVAMDQGDKTIGDLLPQVFETKIKDASGEEHELNGMQYYELQTRYNSYYAEGVQAILANDELSAAEQAAGIATLKSDAATRAKREVLELIGAPTSAVQVSDSGAEKTVYTDKCEGYADKISTAEMAGLRMTVNAQKSYYDPYSHKAMTNSESIHKAKAIADFGLSLSKEETADLMRTMGVSEGIVQAYINDALDEAYNGLEEGYRRLMAEYNGGNG